MTASRWQCPACKSANVSISLPTWYHDNDDGELTLVQVDEEADPLYWACNDCYADGQGEPTRTGEAT